MANSPYSLRIKGRTPNKEDTAAKDTLSLQ